MYAGDSILASITTISTINTYTTGRYVIGSGRNGGAPEIPGNEFFESIYYHQALSHDQMLNVTKNMTYFYDPHGSIPFFPPLAAFSIRRLYPNYYGPVLQVIRSTDSATAQLYADDLGRFTKLVVVTGGPSLILDNS